MSKYESYFAKGGSCPKPSFPCTPADAIRPATCLDGSVVPGSFFGCVHWIVKDLTTDGLISHTGDELHMFIGGNPKEVSWGIFTDEVLDEVAQEYINDPTLAEEKHIYELYRQDLEEELNYEKPPVYKADTIRELAEKIGIDPDALEDTLARYNEFCRKGKDEEFEKNPKFLRPMEKGPFWAIYGQRFSEGAFGGLRVDGQCRVCREDGSYIPGLYGVGDATSAVQRRSGLAVVSELTWATASAFRSAENAAREMGVTV